MQQTAAIVTTLKRPGSSLTSFLHYHQAIGFSKFFLFFDDPRDRSITTATKFSRAQVIRTDEQLRRAWDQTRMARTNPWFYRYVDVELKVRQTLNVEIAIALARAEKIDWLLHIDCDELFYPLNGDAPCHFAAAAKNKLSNLVYANYEGVPETSKINDYFRKVTLFKKNFCVTRHKISASQQRVIKRVPQLPKDLFLFYANGKSAARVTAGLEPDGGHRFKYFAGKHDRTNGTHKPVLCKDAIILHYPCCGFKNFWRKYKMFGAFPDRWFDQVSIREAIGSFHLESRDIVARGNQSEARAFYESRTVIREPDVIESLMTNRICCRITAPSILLNNGTINAAK